MVKTSNMVSAGSKSSFSQFIGKPGPVCTEILLNKSEDDIVFEIHNRISLMFLFLE